MKTTLKYMGVLAAVTGLAPTVIAQEEASNRKALDTVVVTAQFVEQNLQDTPVAITAMSGELLDARGQSNVLDISAQAPNVTLTPGGAFAGPSLVAFIRGVGQSDFNPALEPGVGLYVDDVYYSTLTGSVLELMDLDRVEVLRGPQGTLAGKNSIGGSIKLFTARPDDDSNGYVEVSAGDYNALKFRAASNFTLAEDKLFARISGVSSSRDGYVDTFSYGCLNPTSGFPNNRLAGDCSTGSDGDIDYSAARLALRWLASEDLEVNFSVDYTDDNSGATANVITGYGPTTAPTTIDGSAFGPGATIWPVVGGTAAFPFPVTEFDPSVFLPPDNYTSYADYQGQNGFVLPRERSLESTGVSLNLDWQLNDSLQLQSITGYREYESSFAGDYDASPVPTAALYQTNEHSQISQEIRLNGAAGDFADWTVGGFYFDSESTLTGRISLGYVGFDFIHGPDPVDVTNYAVFANGIAYLTDNLDLAGGIRFTSDEKNYTFRRRNTDLSAIQPCIGPPGTPGNPVNCLISSLDGEADTFEDERMDYRAALTYHITDDANVYASYSTGFKGGGINPRPFYKSQIVTFDPEEMTTYEVGAKAEFFGNTLRVNAAAFLNDYTDVQLGINNCTGFADPGEGFPCLATVNAGDAEVPGFEVEFDWAPIDGLSVDGSFSVLDFEFSELDPLTGLPDDTVPAYTPETSWSLGVQYDISTSFGTIRPRLDASYQDDVYGESNNRDPGTAYSTSGGNLMEARTLLNGSVRWISSDEDWVLSLEGRNLTDEEYFSSIIDSTGGNAGVTYGTPALPRTFMFTARRNF